MGIDKPIHPQTHETQVNNNLMSKTEEACNSLRHALTAISSPSATTSSSTPSSQQQLSRELVIAVTEGIKSQAAKVGFMYSQPERPDERVGEALVAHLTDTTTTLCMLFAGAFISTSSVTLRKALQSAATSVVTSVIALICSTDNSHAATTAASNSSPAIRNGGGSSNNTNNTTNTIAQLAGMCLESCSTAAKAPLDAKTAIGRSLTLIARQLRDATTELLEENEYNTFDEEEEDIEMNGNESDEEGTHVFDVVQYTSIVDAIDIDDIDEKTRNKRREALFDEFKCFLRNSIVGGVILDASIKGLSDAMDDASPSSTTNVTTTTNTATSIMLSIDVIDTHNEGHTLSQWHTKENPEKVFNVCLKSSSTIQRAIALQKKSAHLLEATSVFLQWSMRLLLTMQCISVDEIHVWESVLFHSKQLLSTGDELACSVAYDPCCLDEVKGAAESILTGCQLILDDVDGVDCIELGAVMDAEKQLLELL